MLIAVVIGLIILTIFIMDLQNPNFSVFGQQQQAATTTTIPSVIQPGTVQNEVLKDQVSSTAQAATLPVDAVTIGGIVTAAGGLLLNDRRDKKKLEEKLTAEKLLQEEKDREQKIRDKEVVEILTNLSLIQYKIHAANYLYPDKNPKQILDLKSNNNPMDKMTISEENSKEINRLARLVTVNYDLPPLNMSVPSNQVIQATTNNPDPKPPVVVKPVSPPAPAPAVVNNLTTNQEEVKK